MTRWVVDASVAVKWCFPAESENLGAEARELLLGYQRRDVQFLVPDLFWPELANALWKAVRKQRIDAALAEKMYAKIGELEIPTVSSFEFVPKTLKLAIRHRRTVYDSLYVALALGAQAELITADERLANALAARFPVKWLGAY